MTNIRSRSPCCNSISTGLGAAAASSTASASGDAFAGATGGGVRTDVSAWTNGTTGVTLLNEQHETRMHVQHNITRPIQTSLVYKSKATIRPTHSNVLLVCVLAPLNALFDRLHVTHLIQTADTDCCRTSHIPTNNLMSKHNNQNDNNPSTSLPTPAQ